MSTRRDRASDDFRPSDDDLARIAKADAKRARKRERNKRLVAVKLEWEGRVSVSVDRMVGTLVA